jgi:outer membrane putative beta-barrel porin/alpha-amylase
VRLGLLVLLILAVVGSTAVHAQNVAARIGDTIDGLSDTVAATFARSVPLPSASAGVQYVFDPATGNFQRSPTTFGQVYLDRADPLGKGQMNVSVSYAYLELDTVDGKPANDLRDSAPIPAAGKQAALTIPSFGVRAAVHQMLLAFTYGFTDDLEASIALPLVYSDLGARAEIGFAFVSKKTGLLKQLHLSVNGPDTPFGQGDLLLRSKYRFFHDGPVHLAYGLLLRIPTGDEEAFQGIGFFEVTPSLLASTRVFEPASWARLQAHLNAGAGFDAEDVASSEIRWGLGLDWGFTEQVTAAVAVLARHPLARVAPAGALTFNRCTAGLVTCATSQDVRRGSAPLFGLSSGRFDYYDLSLGGRGGLWRDTLFAFVNVIVPLNDGFVRTEPIPIIGLEATF